MVYRVPEAVGNIMQGALKTVQVTDIVFVPGVMTYKGNALEIVV